MSLPDYLSIRGNEVEYLHLLFNDWANFEENEKYHWALNAYHLIFMLFIYQLLYKTSIWKRDKYTAATINIKGRNYTRRDFLEPDSPYIFSSIRESEVINYLEITKVDSDIIKRCKNLVQNRNERSHANGVYYDRLVYTDRLMEYEELASAIHFFTSTDLKKLLRNYIKFEYSEKDTTIDDIEFRLVIPNHLSYADVRYIGGLCLDKTKKSYKPKLGVLILESWGGVD